MTAVSIIKELRSITGAGIMDCKKALKEANGDIKKSVQIIRNLGKVNIKRQRKYPYIYCWDCITYARRTSANRYSSYSQWSFFYV